MSIFTRYTQRLTEEDKKQLLKISVDMCRQKNITKIESLIKGLNPNAVNIINKVLNDGRIKKTKTAVDKIYDGIINSKSLTDQEKENVFQTIEALYKSPKSQQTSQNLEKNEEDNGIKKRILKKVLIFATSTLFCTSCTLANVTKYMEPFSTNEYMNKKGPMGEFIDYGIERTGLDKPRDFLIKVDTHLDEFGEVTGKVVEKVIDIFSGNKRKNDFQEGQLEQIGFPISTEYLNNTLQEVIKLNANSEKLLFSPNTLCISNEDVTLIRNISNDDNKISVKRTNEGKYKIIPYRREATVIGTESKKTNLNTGEVSELNVEKVTVIGVPNAEGQVLISYIDSYEFGDNIVNYTAFYLTDYSNLSESRRNIEDIEDKYFYADIASFKNEAVVTDQNEKKITKQPGENIYIIDLPKVTSDGIKIKVLYVSPIENADTLMIIKTSTIDLTCLNDINLDDIEQPDKISEPSNNEYITMGNILLYPTKDCRENTEIATIDENVANLKLYPESGKNSKYIELTIKRSSQIIKGWIKAEDTLNLIENSQDIER